MKILVTGRNGQVARSLGERAPGHHGTEISFVGRPELDLGDPAGAARVIDASDADIVVSAAAFTAVDRAEDEPELAHAVNALGAGAIARAAAQRGIPVIHLSTDYVFSGASVAPYMEGDIPDPVSVYGRTKLEGERLVAEANPRHLILRTAWVYSPFGANFVRTMLRLAAERDEIAVVADQWGNPTSAADVAEGVLRAARMLVDDLSGEVGGTCHLAGEGAVNWSGFAEEIFVVSEALGGPGARVRPISSHEYPTRALRPRNSQLASDRLAAMLGWRPPRWQDSVKACVTRILQAGETGRSA